MGITRVTRRPGMEFEITPEMLSAGSNELSGSVPLDLFEGYANSAEVAEAVFRAMWQARPQNKTTEREEEKIAPAGFGVIEASRVEAIAKVSSLHLQRLGQQYLPQRSETLEDGSASPNRWWLSLFRKWAA